MNELELVPGVIHEPQFRLYNDEQRQPTSCDVLVNPGQGWAIATEAAQGIGLIRCQLTLAAKICQQYQIAPEALILFTRYLTTAQEYLHVVRFELGDVDLFAGVRFVGPHRQVLSVEETAALVETLSSGQALAPTWRAVAPRRARV